jgi:hypothetical protein
MVDRRRYLSCEVQSSRGIHQKKKPIAVVDYKKYKIGIDKYGKLMPHCSLEEKS